MIQVIGRLNGEYVEAFDKLNNLERMVIVEYMSGKSIYKIAKEKFYSNNYMCNVFRQAICKLAKKEATRK